MVWCERNTAHCARTRVALKAGVSIRAENTTCVAGQRTTATAATDRTTAAMVQELVRCWIWEWAARAHWVLTGTAAAATPIHELHICHCASHIKLVTAINAWWVGYWGRLAGTECGLKADGLCSSESARAAAHRPWPRTFFKVIVILVTRRCCQHDCFCWCLCC